MHHKHAHTCASCHPRPRILDTLCETSFAVVKARYLWRVRVRLHGTVAPVPDSWRKYLPPPPPPASTHTHTHTLPPVLRFVLAPTSPSHHTPHTASRGWGAAASASLNNALRAASPLRSYEAWEGANRSAAETAVYTSAGVT